MTEASSPRGGRQPRGLLASPLVVVAGALATFLIVLALLAARVTVASQTTGRSTTSAQCSTTGTGSPVLQTTASGQVVASSAGRAACTQGTPTPSVTFTGEQGDE